LLFIIEILTEAHFLTKRQLDEQWRMFSFEGPSSSRDVDTSEYHKLADENKKLLKELNDTKKSLAELVEELIFTESEVNSNYAFNNRGQLDVKRDQVKDLEAKVSYLGKQGSEKSHTIEELNSRPHSLEDYKNKVIALERKLQEEHNARQQLTQGAGELEHHVTSARAIIKELSQEKEDAVNKAKLLEVKAKDLMDKLMVASKQNEELRKNGQFLYSSLKEDKGHYYYTVQTLENLLADSHEILKCLQAENQALKNTKQKKDHQIQSLIKEKQSLGKDLEDAGNTVEELKTVLQLALETFNRGREATPTKAEPLSKKIEELHTQLYALRYFSSVPLCNVTFRNRNSELESELKSSRRELRTYFSIDAADEDNSAHKQFTTLQYEYTSLEKENLELLQNIEQLQMQISELQSYASSKDQNLHTMETEMESGKRLEQDLTAKLDAKDQQLLELNDVIELLEQKNALVEKDLQINCLVMQELLDRRKEVRHTISQYQIEQPVQEYQREIDLLTKKLDDTKSLMSTLLEQDEESRKFLLKNEIENMLNKEMIQLEFRQLQQEKEQLLKETNSLQEENAALKVTVQEKSDFITDMSRATENFQTEVTTLAKDLQQKSQILETVSIELEETHQSNEDKLKIIDKQSTDLSAFREELDICKEQLEHHIKLVGESVSYLLFKDLQDQVKQFEIESIEHIEQLASKQNEIDQLMGLKSHLSGALRDKDTELGNLRSEKTSLKGLLQQQSRDKEKAVAELNILQASLNEKLAMYDKLQQEHELCTNQLEDNKQDLKEISKLQVQALTKEKEISNLQAKSAEQQQEIENLNTQIAELNSLLERLNKQISNHKAELESARSENPHVSTHLHVEQKKPEDELIKQAKYNLELIAELKSQLSLTIDQADTLEKENSQLKEEALLAVSTLDKLKEALVTEKRNSEKALQVQATKLVDLQHLVDVSAKALHEKSLEAELTRKLFEETEKKLVAAHAQEESSKSTDKLQSEITKLTATKKELELENSEYKEIVDKLEDSVKQLQAKGAQISHYKEEAEKLRRKIEALERSILDIKDTMQELKSENDDLKMDLEDRTSELEKITKERDSGLDRLKRSQQISNDLEGQLDATEQELEDLTEKYGKLSKDTQKEILELQENVEKQKKITEKERLESDNRVSQLTKELHLLHMEGNAIKSKYTELKTAAAVEITPIHDLGSLLSNTKDQLIEQLQNELEQIASRFQKSEEDKEELKDLLEGLRNQLETNEAALEYAKGKLDICECNANDNPNKHLLVVKNLELLEEMLTDSAMDQGLKVVLQEATEALSSYSEHDV
jgi:chromosome segregation ATPase